MDRVAGADRQWLCPISTPGKQVRKNPPVLPSPLRPCLLARSTAFRAREVGVWMVVVVVMVVVVAKVAVVHVGAGVANVA